jgi:hypothetical protein
MNYESLEQAYLVQWMRRTYPEARIFAIPNGGGRSMSQGAKLKAEGVSPGVPDLYIPAWRLWVEMKRENGGRIDKDQADWHEYLRSIGDTVIVGYGFADAQKKILAIIHDNA